MTPNQAWRTAAMHLRRDPVLAPLIARYGVCTIRPHTNYYQALIRSIIGQQLSVKAASTINARFLALFGGELPDPAAIVQKSIEELRSTGLSNQKANYIRDLAQHILDGRIAFDHFGRLSNEEIIAELTAVKGIGEWTVHMFLMFCMGRPDVLAPGDLGIRSGIQKLYGLDHLPNPTEVQHLARKNGWHPYETAACWYIWRSLENTLV
jgi:DNA-3-methyladenine glycosylase II